MKGKCTTDHISPAGKWIHYVGNISRISDNTLSVADNAFQPGKLDHVFNQKTGTYDKVSSVAKSYKAANQFSCVVADENYGEGSSREQAAMQPRYLNVQVIIARSFARIHETNLKKQGILALTFANPDDWNKVQEKDRHLGGWDEGLQAREAPHRDPQSRGWVSGPRPGEPHLHRSPDRVVPLWVVA